MSLDHAKKFIAERLQNDADFRDRVTDFVLYRGFEAHTDEFNDGRNGEIKCEAERYCSKVDGYCSYLAGQKGHECSFAGSPHGYEYWVG
ncbi:MAG: hypothetical protein WCG61_01750 [Chlorobium sp.]